MRDDAYKAHAPLTSADIQPTQNPNMRPKHSSLGNSHHQSSLYPLPRILPDPSRSTSRHLNLDTGLSPTEQPQSQSPQAWPSRSQDLMYCSRCFSETSQRMESRTSHPHLDFSGARTTIPCRLSTRNLGWILIKLAKSCNM
jgi:hypothetical protein